MEEKSKKPKIRFKGFTEAWEQRKLSDIYKFSQGMQVEIENQLLNKDSNMEQFIRIIDVTTDNEPPRYIYNTTGKGHVESNDIFFVRYGAVGTVGYGYTGTIANNLFKLTTSKKYCNDFMFQQFANGEFNKKLIEMSASTSMPAINFSALNNLMFYETSLDEQIKIGILFKSIDNLITLHQCKYDKLVNVKKSLLEKMFPQNDSNVPEIRFKGFTEAWEQRKLSEIVTMHARIGWQNLRTSEFLKQGKYMLITGTDFENGAINYSTCHYVEKERYDQDKNIQLQKESILVTKDGTLGKVAYINELKKPATLNAGVFNILVKDKKINNSKYIFQYLKAPFLMDYVYKTATGGTIKHLNQNILVDFPIKLPKHEEQDKIGVLFCELDNLITLHQRKLEKLKNIKKSLLEKMFI